MILLVHMVFGAAIGASIKNISLAIILAFLGHYFLDIFPHIEYSVDNIRNKNWRKSMPDALKVVLDFFTGILIISIFSNSQPVIYFCALVALIPDAFTVISSVLPNKILSLHDEIHNKKVHYFKYKKIPKFWRITTQVIATIISIILLKP